MRQVSGIPSTGAGRAGRPLHVRNGAALLMPAGLFRLVVPPSGPLPSALGRAASPRDPSRLHTAPGAAADRKQWSHDGEACSSTPAAARGLHRRRHGAAPPVARAAAGRAGGLPAGPSGWPEGHQRHGAGGAILPWAHHHQHVRRWGRAGIEGRVCLLPAPGSRPPKNELTEAPLLPQLHGGIHALHLLQRPRPPRLLGLRNRAVSAGAATRASRRLLAPQGACPNMPPAAPQVQ